MKHLTGSARVVNVNKARYKLFCSKSLCEQRLPPNSDALFLHIKRVIYRSSIHRRAIQQFIQAMDGIWLINDPSSGWWWISHHRNWWSTSTTPARNAGVVQTNAHAGHQMYPALTCVVVWSVLMMEPPRTSPFSFKTTVIMMNMTVNEFDAAMWSNVTTECGNLDARLPWDTIICNVNSYPFWFVHSSIKYRWRNQD